MGVFFCQLKKSLYLCIRKSRGGAVVARWAHNPEVVGSNPAPATKIPEVVGSNPAPATKIKSFSILSLKLFFVYAYLPAL